MCANGNFQRDETGAKESNGRGSIGQSHDVGVEAWIGRGPMDQPHDVGVEAWIGRGPIGQSRPVGAKKGIWLDLFALCKGFGRRFGGRNEIFAKIYPSKIAFFRILLYNGRMNLE